MKERLTYVVGLILLWFAVFKVDMPWNIGIVVLVALLLFANSLDRPKAPIAPPLDQSPILHEGQVMVDGKPTRIAILDNVLTKKIKEGDTDVKATFKRLPQNRYELL